MWFSEEWSWLTSLLGLGHHLLILLSVFLGLLCRFGGQITAKKTEVDVNTGFLPCNQNKNRWEKKPPGIPRGNFDELVVLQ